MNPDTSFCSSRSCKRWLIAAAAAIVTAFLLHTLYLARTTDDAYISFRYARNLVQTGEMTWNPGLAPVEGYTNFLWVILNAAAFRLGLPMPLFSLVAGGLAGLGTILLAYRFGRRHCGFGPAGALIAPALLALSGPHARWSVGGLETSLFGFLLLAASHVCVDYWREPRRRKLVGAALILVLATLTRPEGLVVFTLLGACTLLLSPEARRRPGDIAAGIAAFLVPFLIYFLWRWDYFGYLLPNTYYAKTGGSVYQALRGLRYAFEFSYQYLLPIALPVVILAWRIGRGFRGGSPLPVAREHAGVVWCAILSACYMAYVVSVGGDYMMMYRFFAPLMAFFYIVFAFAWLQLWRHARGRRWPRRIAIVLLALAGAGTVMQSTPLGPMISPTPRYQLGTHDGVAPERWMMNRLVMLGKFFDSRKIDSRDSIATDAIGAIGYYTDMRVDDIHGLTDPAIAHLKTPDLGRGWAGHEKADAEHMISLRPTFLMFTRFLTDEPVEPWYPPEVREILDREYEFKAVPLVDEANLGDPSQVQAGLLCFYEKKQRP